MSVVIPLDWIAIDSSVTSGALSEIPRRCRSAPGWTGSGIRARDWERPGSCIKFLIDSFPGELATAAVVTLAPGARKAMHTDRSKASKWSSGLDVGQVIGIHIPLQTNEHAVVESVDGRVHMALGSVYALCVWHPHAVINDGAEERVHLLLNTVIDDELYALLHESNQTGTRHEENGIEDEGDNESVSDSGAVADEHEPCCEDQCPACEPEEE